MKIIEKKLWKEYFDEKSKCDTNFEIRLADWEVNVGDTLILKEWNNDKKEYTGRQIIRRVTKVVKTKRAEDWGIYSKDDIEKYGFQIIGLKPEMSSSWRKNIERD